MNTACRNCKRSFVLDDAHLTGVWAVKCLCGARLPIATDPKSSGQQKRLGKYVLEHLIAKGGMGEIWYGKVSGIEGFEREVAIKLMLPHLSADRDFIRMMVKEAKLTVMLNHPNIVQVYDLAKEGDEYYIAMEYVPGITISTILQHAQEHKSLLPAEVCVHTALQVGRGLAYAHNLSLPNGQTLEVVHRDITPQNILVTKRAFVKVTDFGIARAVNEISTTSPGMIRGKLGYIAPEQLQGKEPDSRVDIFCMGILLWEMLAAKRLFKGTSEADTFRLISECNIPNLKTVRDDVSEALMAVIFNLLQKDPDKRYRRAEDVSQALSTAIFPRSADDYARATEDYFKAHNSLFEGLYQPSTTDIEKNAAQSDEALPDVARFVQAQGAPQPQATGNFQRRRLSTWVTLGGTGVVAAALAVAFMMRTPPVDTKRTADTLTPIASAPRAQGVASALPANAPVASPQAMVPQAPVAPATAPAEKEAASPVKDKALAKKNHTQDSVQHRSKPAALPRSNKPLTGQEIQTAVMRHESSIARCLKNLDAKTAPPEVAARILIETTGKVSEVNFTPSLAKETEACLAKSLQAMRFRRHPVEGLKVTIPLKIQVL